MPNPSTIAMNEADLPAPENLQPTKTRFALLLETSNLKEQVEVLQKLLAEEQQVSAARLEDFNRSVRARNTEVAKLSEQVATQKARNQELLGATSQIGQAMREMEESRDRVLAENCGMTQKLRDLQKIARAAKEYSLAESAYVEVISPSDALTERVANAECELERLLEEHKNIYTLETA